MAFVKCLSAFQLRRLAQSVGRRFGRRRFAHKFLHKLPPVKCPGAFRLRKLAQSLGWALVRAILSVSFRMRWFL